VGLSKVFVGWRRHNADFKLCPTPIDLGFDNLRGNELAFPKIREKCSHEETLLGASLMGRKFANYAEFCVGGSFADRPQEHRSIGSIPLSLIKIDYPAHDIPDPATDNFILCLSLAGTVNAAFRFGERWVKETLRPGMFAPITPPRTLGELRMDAPHRHMVISLPQRAFESMTDEGANPASITDLGYLHERGFRDPFLLQLCLTTWDEARQDNPLGPLFGDCARLALVAGLLRRAGKIRRPEGRFHRFSAIEITRIDSFIDERLDRPMSVSELAAFAQLSEYRFVRSLKATAGLSPHQYVIKRRVELAKERMRDRKQSIAEVALSVGFSDQAHMTATFSRLLGYTPGDWRRRLPS
jgi:AraC family transcriptional regulator